MVSRGWTYAPAATGAWADVTVAMQPAEMTVPAGHVLGLVVTGSDPGFSSGTVSGATIGVDPAGSTVTVPST